MRPVASKAVQVTLPLVAFPIEDRGSRLKQSSCGLKPESGSGIKADKQPGIHSTLRPCHAVTLHLNRIRRSKMRSTKKKVAPSEWERRKETIVDLYSQKPLKDVLAEMKDQHGFTAR